MVNKYDNIDFCSNTLFDFVYGEPTECYKLKYEAKKNVPIEDLKKMDSYKPDQIFKQKIKFKGKFHDKLIFKRYSETSYPVLMRISEYKSNPNNLSNSQLIDMKINYIFSDLAINDVYKFILLPIFNFDVSVSNLNNEEVVSIIKKELPDAKNVCVQLFEHYFKLMTLEEYLIKEHKNFTMKHWKILSFQILYALYKIQKNYPTFRHNKLDLNSIYVYVKKDIEDPKIVKIDDQTFIVPNGKFEIKISNFYWSYIENYAENSEAVSKIDNQYYDVHYIFSSLLKFLEDRKIEEYNFKKFIMDIIPGKYLSKNSGMDEDFYKQDVVTILTPFIILRKNNFFSDFIKEDMSSPISNKPEDIDSFKSQESSIEYLLSSLTESGSGEAPSLLARNISSKTVSGKRKLAVNHIGKSSNVSHKIFNDFGELTEKKSTHKKRKQKRAYSSTSSSEFMDDGYSEKTVAEKPKLDQFFNMFNRQKPQNQIQNNGLFDSIESMAKGKDGGKKKKGKGLKSSILDNLPSGYEGMLPDYLQNMMPPVNNSMYSNGFQQPMGLQNGFMDPNSNMYMQSNQMMGPQMGPEMMSQMGPQMGPQFGQMQPIGSIPQMSMDDQKNSRMQIFDGLMNMKPQNLNQNMDPDHANLLPQHLLMNQQQQPQMANQQPQINYQQQPNNFSGQQMPGMPMMGGKKKKDGKKGKKNFFFLMEAEKK